jgi:hypothetical protein
VRTTPAPRRGRRRAAACGLAVAAMAVAGLAAAGCGARRPVTSGGHQASAQPVTTRAPDLHALAVRYLAIARPANEKLDDEVDGYRDAERDGDLAKARADLRAQVATERGFDRQLLRIRFPGYIATTVRALVRANERRIALTLRQAHATSVSGIRALDRRHKAADAAVETQVRLIRQFLALPPPATS